MKLISLCFLLVGVAAGVRGQTEEAPIIEKPIAYGNWRYKSIATGEDQSLRDLASGKKLVMVVYYAPWCPNWRHDAPIVQKLYEKYKTAGFGVVGVGEYGSASSMKDSIELNKITFPVVFESEFRTDKQKTMHYGYRTAVGDKRDWGSPWYIFLEPEKFEKEGNVLTRRANVVSGELVQAEGEKLIREKLGLPAEKIAVAPAAKASEVCDPSKSSTPRLRMPLEQ